MIFNLGTVAAAGGASDPHYANVSLLLHGDGADASTTITDSGPYGLTPTLNGNVQIDTAQSQFGGASIEFDGTDDYLVYSAASLWQLTGDYTIEFWMRVSSADQYDCVIGNWEASNDDSWLFFLNEAGNAGISFWVHAFNSGVAPFLSSTTNVHDGNWHNVAVSYDGTTTRLFVDGTVEDSSTASFTITSANSNKLHIGTQGLTLSRTITGHLDEIRITKGVCRYTGNYTVATGAFPEQSPEAASGTVYLENDAYTDFLWRANDGKLTDVAYNYTLVENGTVTIEDAASGGSLAPSKQGSGWGGSNFLHISNTSVAAPGTGDFTFEALVYLPTGFGLAGAGCIWGSWSGVTHSIRPMFYVSPSREVGMGFYSPGNFYTGSALIPLDEWTWIAVSRVSGVLHFWTGASYGGSQAYASSINPSGDGTLPGIGNRQASPSYPATDVKIAEIRYSSSVGRYDGSTGPAV